jgi:hypothetical protein
MIRQSRLEALLIELRVRAANGSIWGTNRPARSA